MRNYCQSNAWCEHKLRSFGLTKDQVLIAYSLFPMMLGREIIRPSISVVAKSIRRDRKETRTAIRLFEKLGWIQNDGVFWGLNDEILGIILGGEISPTFGGIHPKSGGIHPKSGEIHPKSGERRTMKKSKSPRDKIKIRSDINNDLSRSDNADRIDCPLSPAPLPDWMERRRKEAEEIRKRLEEKKKQP